MFRVTFSNNLWARFSETIRSVIFRKDSLKYNFGLGYRDVREVAKFHEDDDVYEKLREILDDNRLVHSSNDFTTVSRIVNYINSRYPSSVFYGRDLGDTWNNPLDTLASFEIRKELYDQFGEKAKFHNEWKACISTDCDDYAILIYNLCRVAGIEPDRLYLCWIKTKTEWHMNVMFWYAGVPYALEGTYYPKEAMKYFGRVNYFSVAYYKYVKWVWNDKIVLRYTDKINPLGVD